MNKIVDTSSCMQTHADQLNNHEQDMNMLLGVAK